MIGRTLKHYEIESLLGKGGMGVVYRARDTRLHRPVALKLLSPGLVSDPDRKSRFLLEARAAAALTHPAIAQVYDIDEADGQLFIAMEFIDGRTVSRLIADGELDLMGAVEIALQISEGLVRAHDAGILHRDIKSDNIMITKDGHAKLLDFGLAKLFDAPGDDAKADAEGLSRTITKVPGRTIPGTIMGTISYMSPEQARGQKLDGRSDLFSLGIVLYEMVTGELPFKGDSPLDTMHSIAYDEPRPVTVVRKNLPPHVHRIVTGCLRKRPEDRYLNAHALSADLKRLKHDLESGTSLTLPIGERFLQWTERLAVSIPLGKTGILILIAALVLAAVLVVFRINWGALIGPAIIALFAYRFVRNRKKRMIDGLVKKVSKFPSVKAVVVKGDQVTVVSEQAPAKVSIRLTGLVEEINRKLVFGKPVAAEIRNDISEDELQGLLKQTGVVYVRDDVLLGS
jgi:serine/threonine protein kinase